ncbi:hypothetical protein [Desulfoscipio gibsoniae]|uniref:Uncharacterized protein n=1 Tax=Desulfoscipio gibsoniae DSM 7213 TaxID=767817 RepID=R4KK04_9FIRM|nr:hypothetical protein [Desulfoscipio gibsoniae]AGL02969.1 hypothetical protein Desgi_3646 [Desulfoscipio gibsoniae DSM 7213]
MDKFTVRGPGMKCNEITANNLDEALDMAQSHNPGKQVAADAMEVIYVCESGENPDSCQLRLS